MYAICTQYDRVYSQLYRAELGSNLFLARIGGKQMPETAQAASKNRPGICSVCIFIFIYIYRQPRLPLKIGPVYAVCVYLYLIMYIVRGGGGGSQV